MDKIRLGMTREEVGALAEHYFNHIPLRSEHITKPDRLILYYRDGEVTLERPDVDWDYRVVKITHTNITAAPSEQNDGGQDGDSTESQ
jgi:hypothetical protein